MDGIAAAKSGHLGLPLGAAEVGAVLFGQEMSFNPADSKWLNRDRFVLSAGHGSMFLYSWLHMTGYNLPLEEVKNFRQLNSLTPGHPEFAHTDGVEATTGPLGTGVANAVGMAAAAKMAAANYNTPEHQLIDHHVFALCGDGCLQEGVSFEAIAIAGHEGLDNFILVYDSNKVTLDKMADVTQSEDTGARFKAMGWDVYDVDGHDMTQITKAVKDAKSTDNGKPKLIIANTIIAKGIDEVAGTCAGHGEAGVKFTKESRAKLGLPEELFYVSPDTKAFFATRQAEQKSAYAKWQTMFSAWKAANPEKAASLDMAIKQKVPADLLDRIPVFKPGKYATRNAGSEVLQPLATALPYYISGSADLHGSTKNLIKNGGDFSKKNWSGRNMYYGIREHGMGAMMNGFAYYGLNKISGATFLVFCDYLRGAVRVAALTHLPVTYILTHDSIGVGEDGPTHQPVEAVSALRVIPNMDVIRPGDAEETAGAFVQSVMRTDGPTALILSRQDIPTLDDIPVKTRREGVMKGAYVAIKETGPLEKIIIASGSELHLAYDVAKKLGGGIRVVSMPCMEIFERQTAAYKEEVLPASCVRRVAVEAGVTAHWWKYVGFQGKVLGTDKFGLSAPANFVFDAFGINPAGVESLVNSV
ncbi:Transketolase, thiamine diphosphate binding domain-containing protein [Pavlovales sp. CCMP2436]|nr:Transketolase, thiamine diphosphate binding domain-containing protein [Pavlovales sp. CCMP2436]